MYMISRSKVTDHTYKLKQSNLSVPKTGTCTAGVGWGVMQKSTSTIYKCTCSTYTPKEASFSLKITGSVALPCLSKSHLSQCIGQVHIYSVSLHQNICTSIQPYKGRIWKHVPMDERLSASTTI